MTDIAVHRSCDDARPGVLPAMLGDSLHRATIARETRRTLMVLPDNLLKDIGVTRDEIPYVAGVLVEEDCDPRAAAGWRDRKIAGQGASSGWLSRATMRVALTALAVVSMLVLVSSAVFAGNAQVERGQYLVTLGGCNDCHTPGYFFGKPDLARFLGGSEVGFEIPGLGVFHGPNLTPDPDTGLGAWTEQEIATAITTGRRPDGRILAPIMPWHAFAALTGEDVRAIAAFLKSLPPVRNKVPGPFGPNEQPSSFVMKIVAPPAATTGNAPAQ